MNSDQNKENSFNKFWELIKKIYKLSTLLTLF